MMIEANPSTDGGVYYRIGWLFNDMTVDKWQDGGKNKYSYERYYAIGNDSKAWMNGRVVNPFCSREDKDDPFGILTRLRAYRFYTPDPRVADWLSDRCSDLQVKQ